MGVREELVGEKFGSWTVLGVSTENRRKVICRCRCGFKTGVDYLNLRRGKSTQCRGCAVTEQNWTHGKSGSPVYRAWDLAKRRGGVAPHWESFVKFYKDMGDKPDGHALHRPDRSRPLGPGNAEWKPISGARSEYNEDRDSWKPSHALAGIGKRQRAILKLLKRCRGPMRLAVIAGMVGASENTARDSLKGLRKRGLTRQLENLEWDLVR